MFDPCSCELLDPFVIWDSRLLHYIEISIDDLGYVIGRIHIRGAWISNLGEIRNNTI
jgi:hypothetical protein